MQKQLPVGSRWLSDGQVVEIDGPLSDHQVQVRSVSTGKLTLVAPSSLLPLSPRGTEEDLSSISQSEWDRALSLAKVFAQYVACRLPNSVAEDLAKKYLVSQRQIRRWMALYRESQRTTALIPRRGGRPVGVRLLAPAVEQLIQHVISKHYARREAASQSEVCERVRLICRRLNLSPPDPKTIVSRIRAQNSFDLARKRYGSKVARQQFEARPGKLVVEQPLDLVQIDHTLADINIVDDDDPSIVIGRPWLTLAIDVATRCVVGYYLTMDAPSAISLAMCLENVMLPKNEIGLDGDSWPMFGKPARILADNGKDLRSLAFQRGCEQHNMALDWRPVAEPHYGAHIERLMGTFMRKVHTLPGTTFSNVRQRGNYASEQKACLTLGDFRAWLVEQICHGYHVRHHRGLGQPPLLAWEQAWSAVEMGALALPSPMDRQALRRDFYPFVYRRLQRTGVQFGRSRYWSPALAPMIEPAQVVRVHYHPGNPTCVWVSAGDNVLIEAKVVAGVALGEASRLKLDVGAQVRLDNLKLRGYDHGDAIRHRAERRKARHGSANSGNCAVTKRLKKAPATDADSGYMRPPVPLNRSSVHVEVLDS